MSQINCPNGDKEPPKTQGAFAFMERWLVVFLRAFFIACLSAASLALLALSCWIFWTGVTHMPGGLHLAVLFGLPSTAIASWIAWRCYKEAAATLLMAKGKTPAKLGAEMPVTFTFINCMITIALLGILSSIALPMFAGLLRKSNEGASKGNLGAIRSALSIYYGDMHGQYPSELTALTVGGKYLSVISMAKAPNYHTDSSAVRYGKAPDDSGGWLYNNIPGDANMGSIMVNCTHTDTRGTTWTSY